ncbi:MAG: RDD family protein [Candidatus Pelagibacter sp.]
MSVGLWVIIILFIYFGVAPLIAYNSYKNLKFSKLPPKKYYTGFWLRFGSGVCDFIILFIIGFISGYFIQLIFYDTVFGKSFETVLGIAISWSYICLFQSSKYQATLGQKLCGIKISDQNFKKLTLGRATLRYFCLSLSGLILLIGYFMIGFTKKKTRFTRYIL